jgi:hypothetical protein
MPAMAAMAAMALPQVRLAIPVLQVRTTLLVLRLVTQALGAWAAEAVRVVAVGLVKTAQMLPATILVIAKQALMAEPVVMVLLAETVQLVVWVGRWFPVKPHPSRLVTLGPVVPVKQAESVAMVAMDKMVKQVVSVQLVLTASLPALRADLFQPLKRVRLRLAVPTARPLARKPRAKDPSHWALRSVGWLAHRPAASAVLPSVAELGPVA